MKIKEFIKHHYRHFNAASLVDAAEAYESHLKAGGKMLVTLAGAMSTGELGISFSEMILACRLPKNQCKKYRYPLNKTFLLRA